MKNNKSNIFVNSVILLNFQKGIDDRNTTIAYT